ncbi:hypothetical protein [Nocardiopsis sp. JB363]|uniref:TPR repeat region-containing protein n=1 Tax=Nocardiopsis sp. JB363 TaxID=1434837 RepID=UPI00097A702F|nr:hypothetical protein [Nocardiopsis sp. JB363]SIO85022.1 hypothetical protein BQ8420_04850 [Nocardiopsis sp. JB363]
MYFSPTPCEIDTGKLDQAADDMLEIVGRITGKSGDLESLFTAAALEFSDLIAENLQSTANENHSAWTSALTTCWHVWGVVTKWSGDVERYKARIASLQEEWDAAVGNNFGFPEDDAGGIEARRALAGALNDRAQGHWETLEGEAEDNSDNLKGGPTVSNLRELVDSGVLGFAAYNSTRQIMYYPSTFDTGTRDAENMADYLTGEKELDDEYYRLLEQLAALTALAAEAKRNGEHPRGYELEYLEEFYASLEEEVEGGVVELPGQFDDENLSDEQREQALGTLGDGLLVLSDEAVGGGYDSVPASIQYVLEGPDFSTDQSGRGALNILQNWRDQAEGLGELLVHSDETLEGGAEFSARVIDTVSREVDRISNLATSHTQDDNDMSILLDVATRNDDANYALLTGEYPEGVDVDLPWEGSSADSRREKALEHLYTHEWGDDGAAVRKITDWIADGPAAGDDDTEGEHRETALMALMELMVDSEFEDSLFNTGSHVDDGDVTWHNVSASHLNSELADSFADIFIAFQDDFANTDGIPGNVEIGLGEGIEITDEARMAFTRFAVGDPDAAAKIYGESLLTTAEAMEEYATNTGERTHGPAHSAASLQALVEVALLNESTMREANDQEFAEYRNKVNTAAINLIGGAAGDKGASGLIVEIGKAIAGEAFAVSDESGKPHVGVNGEWVESERMMGYALGVAAEQDPELMAVLEEEGIAKKDGSGDIYVPPDHVDWEISGSESALSDHYHRIDERDWPDGESDTRDAVEDFIGAFDRTASKWEKHIVDESGEKVNGEDE